MDSNVIPHRGSLARPAPDRRPIPERLRAVARDLARARWLWVSLGLFLVTRLGIALVAYMAPLLLAPSTDPPLYHLRGTENVWLDVFASRWDTGFYISIVEEGYMYRDVELPSVAFFPLLPLLMRAIMPLVGDAAVAGLLVTNLALLAATMIFYRLVAEAWDDDIAGRAVWYLLIFPAAFFGSAIYSEALFLLGAVGALYAARRRRWWLAGLLAALTSAARFTGLIVGPLLLLEWARMRWRGDPATRPGWPALAAPLVTPLGLLGYMGYLEWRFGAPLAFSRAMAEWGRTPRAPFATLSQLVTRPAEGWIAALLAGQVPLNDWIDLAFIALFLSLSLILLYEHRWSEGLFVWLGVFLGFSSGLLMSQRRYVWVLFPVYVLLARWGRHPLVDRLITALFLTGLALFTALFANGYWVG